VTSATRRTIDFANVPNSSSVNFLPDSSGWSFEFHFPGVGTVPVVLGATPSQWTFNGVAMPSALVQCAEFMRRAFRAILLFAMGWKAGVRVLHLLFNV
jgi:hypothetical protein